jgi:hypothetical protein
VSVVSISSFIFTIMIILGDLYSDPDINDAPPLFLNCGITAGLKPHPVFFICRFYPIFNIHFYFLMAEIEELRAIII